MLEIQNIENKSSWRNGICVYTNTISSPAKFAISYDV
jgi:hypothetical protein